MMNEIEWLKGLTCTDIQGSAGNWTFIFSSECQLIVNTAWRLVSEGTISLTHSDHGKRWGRNPPIDALSEVTEMLKGAVISHAFTNARGDLSIDFHGPHTLEVIIMGSLYEQWDLTTSHGKHYVAMGGGEVAYWD